MIFPPDFDAADRAYIESFGRSAGNSIPDDAVIDGKVTVIIYSDPNTGERQWLPHCNANAPVSTVVGILEMAKLDIMHRTPGTWTDTQNEGED